MLWSFFSQSGERRKNLNRCLTFTGPCTVIYFCSKTNQVRQCIKFILFWHDTLRVSDGLPVHHQQFKTVHTATGICQTDTAVCLLVGTRWNGVQDCTYSNRHMSNRYCYCLLASRQQYLFVICLLLYVQYSLELIVDGKTV